MSRLVAVALATMLPAISSGYSNAAPAPPGRAWAPTEVLSVPGALNLGGGIMESDAEGRPLVLVEPQWSLGQYDWVLIQWEDSAWAAPVATNVGLRFRPVPIVSRGPGTYATWIIYNQLSGMHWQMFSELGPQGVAWEDTALRLVSSQDSEYAGARFLRRRWVARSQQRQPNDLTFIVRVAYSDTVGIWHEVESRGYDSDLGCSLAPVSDSVALLAHSGPSIPLKVETLTNGLWTDSTVADPRPGKAIHPRFALRKSGGHWLAWSTVTSVRMSSNKTGEWMLEDVLLGQHLPGETFLTGWIDVSRDGRERPIVVWSDFGYGFTYRDVACAAFPTATGWTAGFEIPDSGNQFTSPFVARDLNGDGWFAWKLLGQRVVKWTHTYVKATASKPWIGGPFAPIVHWELSERAPESRWTVLRSVGGGEYQPIGTVVAGEDTVLSLADPDAPRGPFVRYRIRRESVNRRYEWTSPEALWLPKKPRLRILELNANPVRDRVEFTLEGARDGELDLRLYDIQGREVLRERAAAAGGGRDSVRLTLSRAGAGLRPGLYFLRVVDSAGETSAPFRIVVLR